MGDGKRRGERRKRRALRDSALAKNFLFRHEGVEFGCNTVKYTDNSFCRRRTRVWAIAGDVFFFLMIIGQ